MDPNVEQIINSANLVDVELTSLKSALSRMEAELADAESAVSVLRSKNSMLEAEVLALRQQLEDCKNDHTGNLTLGIRVFPHYENKTYGDDDAVMDALKRLGIKRVSTLLTPQTDEDDIAFMVRAHEELGIKFWLAIGAPGKVLASAGWKKIRDALSGPLRGIVEIVSGWNEPNHGIDGDWVTLTAEHQRKLYNNIQLVNAESDQSIKVGTPPLWSGNVKEQYKHLNQLAPKIQGAYDIINWHLYPHGKKGTDLANMLDLQIERYKAAYGDVPILNSESGYFTAPNYSGGSNPSTEPEQAEELPLWVDMHLERGIMFSYFELLDDPDPKGTNREANFGLIRCPSLDSSTWSDKPAFEAYRKKIAE